MKKILLLAAIQAVAIFLITGLLTLVFKGDFFYRFLAPIAGLGAGFFRMLTAYMMEVMEQMAKQKQKDK